MGMNLTSPQLAAGDDDDGGGGGGGGGREKTAAPPTAPHSPLHSTPRGAFTTTPAPPPLH